MAVAIPYLYAAMFATSVVATVSSYQANKRAASQSQQIGEANAAIDMEQSAVALDQSNFEANQIRDRNRRLAATQRAGFLKSGITLEGTPQDVIYDSALQGELEALSTVYEGQIKANYARKQASIDRYEGASRSSAYKSAATGSLISGVGDALSIAAKGASYNNPKFKAA